MAINAYTGLMGSGKSYEVVSSIILPAIQAGRRVVTNIDGINPQAIQDYILERTKLTADKLGEIVTFTNEDIAATNFFPSEDDPHSENNVTILKAGDLLAVDECWKFWSSDNKISEAHMTFFRMHRHYTHPVTGVSCDVALMIQDIGTLHRKLRAVVEMSTRTVKLKTLGMASKYRIELYEGNKLTQKAHIDTFNKGYKAEIFPLYKSYAAGDGKETSIDKRQNILLNSWLWIKVVLFILAVGWGLWYAIGFFRGEHTPGASPSTQTGAPVPAVPQKLVYSMDWRIVGRFDTFDHHWVVVSNSAGRIRLESPSAFANSGYTQIGEVDGLKATLWTGSGTAPFFQPVAPAPSPTAASK
jgi:zona occludens toxin